MHHSENNKNNSIYSISVTALMAAFVFVATYLRIEIPTPIGRTMLHFGNIFCLLSGLLLGAKRGGAAAGIGSMIFDILGGWADSAPFTLVFKFLMAYICGSIAYSGKRDAKSLPFNITGAICGSLTYTVLYLGKNFVTDYLLNHLAYEAVIASLIPKAIASLTNGVTAVIVSIILLPIFREVLSKSGTRDKLFPINP